MIIQTETVSLSTKGDTDIIDITDTVQEIIDRHSIRSGQALLFVPGSTGGLTTVEYEPGLIQDLPEAYERFAPTGRTYHHDAAWGDGNGYAHVRASITGPSLNVPISGGRMTLGTWQQIIFIDFDNRPRNREIVVQLMGTTEPER
jgi:secondary thiamine-phosphate synthase enzyme